jgi:hypothetical protein
MHLCGPLLGTRNNKKIKPIRLNKLNAQNYNSFIKNEEQQTKWIGTCTAVTQ